MSAYQPPGFDAPIDLDLSRNEGRPFIAPVGHDAVTNAATISRYPDTRHLTRLVAGRHGIGEDRVLVTAGGDDALLRCFLAFRGPVVATDPSFEMIRRYAGQTNRDLIEVEWWEGDLPIAEILDVDAQMAVIVSPNNPTGSVISEADLRKVADRLPLVVLDAAYAEFADEDLTPIALELENVVVLRTLSKAFGLAGLRVGYALGSAESIEEMAGFGSPYPVSGPSARLAERALESDGNAQGFATIISAERRALTASLAALGGTPLPSAANFVLATDVDSDWLVQGAASLGVGLRRFPDRPNLDRSVRIGLPGDPVDFERLVEVLQTVLAPRAVLFDMDGVLADVRESLRATIAMTAADLGVAVSDDDIVAAKAGGDASDDWELTRRLCAASGVEVSYDEVRERFELIYQGSEGSPGLKARERLLVDRDLLSQWADRLSLGVVTARPRTDAQEFLDRFDIARYFSTVVTREDAPPKPDPAPVRLALDRLDVGSAWMVGDTVDDLTAARKAGVVPIAVAVPGDDISSLAGAAHILESVNRLQEVLDATSG